MRPMEVPQQQPQVPHLDVFQQQPTRRLNHVVVVIVRKAGAQLVTWLCGAAVPDSVRVNDVEPPYVERLIRLEQFT